MHILILLFFSFCLNGFSAPLPESKVLFSKALMTMNQYMPGAFLALVNGNLTKVPECEGAVEWQYLFQTSRKIPPAGGYVSFTSAPTQGGCEHKARSVVDSNMANMNGYTFLAKHDNLDMVHFEWSDVLTIIESKYPNFVWSGSFTVYSPLVPGYSKHVYYRMPGSLAGSSFQVIVDASNGEIQ